VFSRNRRPTEAAPALHDLAPLRALLERLVDFDALNAPEAPRVTLTATDLLAGDRITFDSRRGDRIGLDEVIASCSLPPLFPPTELRGRLMADGCLTGNTPLEAALSEAWAEEVLCVAVELFARQGTRPDSLSAAAARATDVMFGSRTRDAIAAEQRVHALRNALRVADAEAPQAAGPRRVSVLVVGMRAEPDDAGMLKPFDFSPVALQQRRAAGAATMAAALALPRAEGEAFVLHEVTSPGTVEGG
jgi:NTE family protein